MWSIFLLVMVAIVLGVVAWLVFIWAARSGQFEDPEGPKYRMLDDDDLDEHHKKKDEPKP